MKTDRLSGFNPLRGLQLDGAINFLEQGERGYYADLMWLYRTVLRRNGTARAVRRKLTSAIAKLDWNIKIPDKLEGERKALAERQQAELRRAFDLLTNFRAALRHLAFADIVGFAHLEKVYARGGNDPWAVRELRVVPQWHMCRDGLFSPWCYNADARVTNSGTPIPQEHWIWREVEDPAAEIFLIAHLKQASTDADWDQFNDTYAVPPIFVEGPPNVRREDEPYYQQTAESVVSDSRGYLPNGSKLHTLSPGAGASSTFTERLRYYREEIVIAGTGGILTTLDGNTGIGKGPADNHEDAWIDIAHAIGMDVSETLQDQFAAPILKRLFPGEEIMAYFELEKPVATPEAGQIFEDAKAAMEAGYKISAEEVSEKSGYTLETGERKPESGKEEGAPVVPPVQQSPTPTSGALQTTEEDPRAVAGGEASPALVQAALADDLELEARWLAPVADVLGELEAALADPARPLEDVLALIERAADGMPSLLGKLDVAALADALEKASGPAALEGLSAGLAAKRGRKGA